MGTGRSCACSANTYDGDLDLDAMLTNCNSGDIILFDDPMQHSYFIKFATDSKWNHVGMILKYTKNPAETILVESAGCGVFICYARERLMAVLTCDNPTTIGYRKLGPKDGPQTKPEWKKRLHKEAERLIDTPYEQNFSDFIKAWAGEDEYAKWLLSYMGGNFAEGATKGEDLNSIFCSELAAHLFKHMQLLDPKFERDSNGYLPKDFSSATNAYLQLKAPHMLATEKRVLVGINPAAKMSVENASGKGASPANLHNAREGIATIGDFVDKRKTTSQGWNATSGLKAAVQHAIELEKKKPGGGDKATIAGLEEKLKTL